MAGRLGFVGLGVMGGPMAGHLLKAGRTVTVWNRTPEKSEPLRESGATVAPDLATVGETCDIVFLCVRGSEDVAECLEGMRDAHPGTLFVDHSTIAPPAAEGLHKELTSRGHRFVDAPITGGSTGAKNGQLTIFLGGEESDCAEAKDAMAPYSKRAERVGPGGAGQLAKMANQIAVGGALLALCETLSFAKKAGLDTAQIRSLVGGGSGGSWAFENYGKMILAEDWTPGFSVDNQRKDLAYCRVAADEVDAAIPCTDLVDRLLAPLQEEGRGGDTTAALYEVLLGMGA